MKRVVCIMFLVIALVSTNVWALKWDPDGDANLTFNMNFENHTGYATTDAEAGKVGNLIDYNTAPAWDPNNFWDTAHAIRGSACGNYGKLNDKKHWGESPNDVGVRLGTPGTATCPGYIFELGYYYDKRSYSFWFNDVDVNEPGEPTDYDLYLAGDPCYAYANPDYPLSTDSNRPGYICQRNLTESTILRYVHYAQAAIDDAKRKWWEIRINGGRLEFRQGDGHLFMTTKEPLTELGTPGVLDNDGHSRLEVTGKDSNGVDPNTWHHAIVVVDRTARNNSKMYIDGLEVPVTVISYAQTKSTVDSGNKSPIWIGAGYSYTPLNGYEFDGMLDEVRVYNRAMDAEKACVLYQWDTDDPNALALRPYVNEDDVVMDTGLEWDPARGTITQQKIYFGTNPDNFGAAKWTYSNGTSSTLANSKLNGTKLLTPDTTYYWKVDSNNSGVWFTGHVWPFTVESGKAYNPTPGNGAVDIHDYSQVGKTDLSWATHITSGVTYDVFFGDDPCALTKIKDDTTNAFFLDVNTPTPGKYYYWRINTSYANTNPPIEVEGDIWQFRTEAWKLVFNTDDAIVKYSDHNVPPLTCELKQGNTWQGAPVMTGSIASDGVAVFTQTPVDFYYDSQYDIVVVPDSFAESGGNHNDNTVVPTPVAIHVTGDFYFDGTMDISGDNSDPLDPDNAPKARCGGHRGARKEVSAGDFGPENPLGYYYQKLEYESRWGDQRLHWYSVPTTVNTKVPSNHSGYEIFGPGCSETAPYKDSGGAGYGGVGGDSGRGFVCGIFAGGASYGDKEVPVPFGGSAASWSQQNSGAAGGGGVEIVAAKVTLDTHAKILSKGGTHTWTAMQYPAGGGSGGSVKIVSDGDFNNMGLIDVSGGRGQDAAEKADNGAGGGGGGRVAIFYGGACNQGDIRAEGSEHGVTRGSGSYPHHEGWSVATDGEDGTIYIAECNAVNEEFFRKASAPTPRDGDRLVYVGDTNEITLKWYSGYNPTDACDVVYCDTSNPPTTPIGIPVPATRGQHSSTVTKSIVPDTTYYMRVQTVPKVGAPAFLPVDSNTWEFSTVGWECLEPNWGIPSSSNQTLDANIPSTNAYMAGWPAWDQNHDCIVNNEDLWYFAERWRQGYEHREYIVNMNRFSQFVNEWMTCRARVNKSSNTVCTDEDWEPTQDWKPVGGTGL